jgi:hypothetical protein
LQCLAQNVLTNFIPLLSIIRDLKKTSPKASKQPVKSMCQGVMHRECGVSTTYRGELDSYIIAQARALLHLCSKCVKHAVRRNICAKSGGIFISAAVTGFLPASFAALFTNDSLEANTHKANRGRIAIERKELNLVKPHRLLGPCIPNPPMVHP